ncbi:hypothetical protein NL676_002863 [Syzygium grande]|nr:hypothetical protein NL676_002863 [Syzygium grande]
MLVYLSIACTYIMKPLNVMKMMRGVEGCAVVEETAAVGDGGDEEDGADGGEHSRGRWRRGQRPSCHSRWRN